MPPIHKPKPTPAILAELVNLLRPQPPSREDGWLTMAELVQELGFSEAVIRRRFKRVQPEKRRVNNLMYYRVVHPNGNGKPKA